MPLFRRRSPPAQKALDPYGKRPAPLEDYIGGRIRPDGPGVAIAVVRSGTVVYAAGYGLADIARNAAAQPDTFFHLASCGKQFTGLGILMLAEAGRLRLDDPVGAHLDGLAGYGPGVTIRRLLHHTSGVRDFYDDDGVEEILARCEQPTNADVIQTYADLGCPMAGYGTKPGDTFTYSNSGYELLGSVIESAAGQSYRDFFQQRVFEPSGMTDTFSVPDRRVGTRRCAIGYGLDDRGELFAEGPSEFDDLVGAGSFYTTVSDLCLYDRALATNALISAASMRAALTSGETKDGRQTGYGFGWFIGDDKLGRFADHEGSWTGFYAYIRRYLTPSLSVFVLSNNPALNLAEVASEAVTAYG